MWRGASLQLRSVATCSALVVARRVTSELERGGNHPGRAGEASRVLHPLRFGASESSAKGRSATRSDSQRPQRRTRWDGHPAWGSNARLCLPVRTAYQPIGGRREKNGGPAPRPRIVYVWNGRLATTGRLFRFLGVPGRIGDGKATGRRVESGAPACAVPSGCSARVTPAIERAPRNLLRLDSHTSRQICIDSKRRRFPMLGGLLKRICQPQ